jgi:uncharacterized protein YdiU (UPF0061 family)
VGPELVAASEEALSLLDLDPTEINRPQFAEYMCGNQIMPGSEPTAHCYCGHQFGNFAGQLGDGRAILLGEVTNSKGEKWELQLKGAGKTPFSRSADGRAVLRSSIREFLCSEALYHLGIPTTRAGSIVTSDSLVIRDIKYDGHPIKERATVCLRIAPSFIRFGSFEIFKPTDEMTGREGPSVGLEKEMLPELLNFVIKNHYIDIWNKFENPQDRYLAFYSELVRRTAYMVAKWQSVGWCHGVLNTDNLSVLGLTIDYGPFGFLDFYDPDFICNASDDGGRYSYKNQPSICKWDLEKLGEALNPVLPLSKTKPEWDKYDMWFKQYYMETMRNKLGLALQLDGDTALIESLFETMRLTGADFTNTFRNLNRVDIPGHEPMELQESDEALESLVLSVAPPKTLAKAAAPSVPPEQLRMLIMLAQQNPQMLMMFGKSPEFLLNQVHKMERYEELKNMTTQQKYTNDRALWGKWLLSYRRRLWQEVEGVLQDKAEQIRVNRIHTMNSVNPVYILRNWIAQSAIAKAEKGDFSEVHDVFNLLKNPYQEQETFRARNYNGLPPDWAGDLCVT